MSTKIPETKRFGVWGYVLGYYIMACLTAGYISNHQELCPEDDLRKARCETSQFAGIIFGGVAWPLYGGLQFGIAVTKWP